MTNPTPVRIALKVDVDTLRGTREGVPALLRLFDQYQVRATFLFSFGPDHTGRALRRIFRPGFIGKVGRTSVLQHYGLKTLLYGTLLPGPHIGRTAAAEMRAVRDAGHECGIHTYDHVRWQDYVSARDAAWTRAEMQHALEAYVETFGCTPATHGAAGWQMNDSAYLWEQEQGFRYASDTRGSGPFRPVVSGQALSCVQLPTTLPTLDELIGLEGCTEANVHDRLLQASREPGANGHVYTLHAELEGQKLLPVMQRLLEAWRGYGYSMGALDDLYGSLDLSTIPQGSVGYGEVRGRSGLVATQLQA